MTMRDRCNFGDTMPICLIEDVQRMTIEPMTADRTTISINKTCELVGVSRGTIYNWMARGNVEYVRTAGGSVRIFVDTLWRTPDDTAISRRDGRAVAAAGSSIPS